MNARFEERMKDDQVRRDCAIVADFIAIYCSARHSDQERSPVNTDAASLGVYASNPPVMCSECEAHLRYAEARRAYCPKDPKPFCSHCDTHCYSASESEWEREMMRFSGPRSWMHGHAIDGLRHLAEGLALKRADKRAGSTAHADKEEA